MDFKEIKKIVELMEQYGLTQFKLEQEETKLELKRGADFDASMVQRLLASAPVPHYAAPAPAPASPAPAAGDAPSADSGALPAGVKEITSPMVGTFYTAPSPDADDFVKVGARIAADDTVCIVEAMKVMNEIKAEISGEIVEVLVENGTAVQFGEALFRVKTA